MCPQFRLVWWSFPHFKIDGDSVSLAGVERSPGGKMTKDLVRSIGIIFLGLAALLTFSIAPPTHAQVTGATISGTVTDPSGAAVPNATVTAKNNGTGVTNSAKTNADGFYTIPNLLPGTYDVTTTASGFSIRVDHNLTLAVGAQQALPMTL